MTGSGQKTRASVLIKRFRAVAFLLLTVLIFCASAETVAAQGIPPRSNVLQSYKPVATPPVSQVERLREDIINATNPETGALSVNRITTSRPWLGAGQAVPGGAPAKTSRPWVNPRQYVPGRPPATTSRPWLTPSGGSPPFPKQ
jgi:hypothetical protein